MVILRNVNQNLTLETCEFITRFKNKICLCNKLLKIFALFNHQNLKSMPVKKLEQKMVIVNYNNNTGTVM